MEPIENSLIQVPRSELKELIQQNAQYSEEIEKLKTAVLSIVGLLGLTDENGKVNPAVISGEESVMGPILKGVGNITTLLTQSQAPSWLGGNKAKKELEKKFCFYKRHFTINSEVWKLMTQ